MTVSRPLLLALLALLLCAAPSEAASKPPPPDPVRVTLDRLEGTADAAELAADRSTYTRALEAVADLDGKPKRELRSVVRITKDMATRGVLTADRLHVVFLTLQRNVEWWTAHHAPAAGSPGEKDAAGRKCKPLPKARAARVTFPGSGVVWQYYPGLGIQLQVNGTFAAANALLQSTRAGAAQEAGAILDEMRGLTVARGGATTWEYLFPFGGGKPPWASGLSQATAIRAYLAAATKLARPDLQAFAMRLSRLFVLRPPLGVNDRLERDGSWYALYTFTPGTHVLNAHLNAVIALHDLAQATHDPAATRLADEGLRAARRRITGFDLGVWSRYAEKGPAADLNYHVLNRDLARGLCQRTGQEAICRAWHSFTRELQKRCPRPATTPDPEPAPAPAPTSPPAVVPAPDVSGGTPAG